MTGEQKPTAWLCEFEAEDGTVTKQVVYEDPDGLRFNDIGEPSPFKVTPLFTRPPSVLWVVEYGAIDLPLNADARIVGAEVFADRESAEEHARDHEFNARVLMAIEVAR